MGYMDFTFNGISARDMRIRSVRVDEGIMTLPFVTSANASTVKLPDNTETYLYKAQRENLTIQLQLMKVDERGNPKVWTQRDIYEVADWLVVDNYKPLTLGDRTGIMYYAYLQDSESLLHYGNGGILPIVFMTNSPFGWSVPQMEAFNVAETQTIQVINKSNVLKYFRPTVQITNTKANGTITLTNTTINDPPIELKQLYANEIISMDNEREIIHTDKPLATLGNRFNYEWLKLQRGVNNISVSGDCSIIVRQQFPIVT